MSRFCASLSALLVLACSVGANAGVSVTGDAAHGWRVETPSYTVLLRPERGLISGLTRAGSSINTVAGNTFSWHPDRGVWTDDWDAEDSSPRLVDWKCTPEKFDGGEKLFCDFNPFSYCI